MTKFSKLLALATLALVAFSVVLPTRTEAQASISTGNISGAITDPAGAVVPGAKVTITSKSTGAVTNFTSTGAGTFNSGPIGPGDYTVRLEAKGFKTTAITTAVLVGGTTPLNVQLEVGSEEQVIEVTSEAVSVNSEQSTVQGVLTTKQIDELPINGRNFLEVAQLEPGVQIQDASNFDPTKGGFTGISIGGRSGRTTRISVDGLDVSDETVGTSVANLSTSAIQEFSISQSSLDLSTELTTTGAVNVVTRSGSNTFHGEAFYFFRDESLAANFAGGQDPPFQRNQFGGRFGGPLLKDRIFIFANVERVKQDLLIPVVFGGNFAGLTGTRPAPFREVTSLARIDFTLPNGARLFYKLGYNNADGTTNTLPNYSAFLNTNNTPSHTFGADFSTGNFAHSIRLGHLFFQNHIGDAPSRPAATDLIPQVQVRVGSFRSGPNPLAPQATFQTNTQIKYDGSWIRGSHTIRYGAGFNRIRGGGFASFFQIGPRVRGSTSAAGTAFAADSCDPGRLAGGAATMLGSQPCFPGGVTDPRNYPVFQALIGNGQGFFTDLPQFGFPAGGQFDNRLQWYVGDTWKIKSNLTVNFGVRYVRDTGRTNSDLGSIPCSAIDFTLFDPDPTCTGNILDLFGSGLGAPVRQDNNNFGGNVGFAWDPMKNGKTIIRGGAAVVYDTAIFNNILFSRPLMLSRGLFNGVFDVCGQGGLFFPGGTFVDVTPDGSDIATQICGQAVGAPSLGGMGTSTVALELAALQSDFQAAIAAAGVSGNPSFIGNTLAPIGDFGNLLDPNYRTPYSYQMNIGIQRELRPGLVVSADFVRNVSLRYLLAQDTNFVGDSRFLNTTAAANAIALTVADCGAADLAAVVALSAGGMPCPDPTFRGGPTSTSPDIPGIGDFAARGLDSGRTVLGGFGAPAFGAPCDFGAAFPGVNCEVGGNDMLHPVGRSTYTALQVSVRGNISNPFPLVKSLNLQGGYTWSRFNTMAGDQDFINFAESNRGAGAFFGPASFDRSHAGSIGAIFDFQKFARISLITHLRSPLAATFRIADDRNHGLGREGEIFFSDFDGDGTVGDILAGSNIGEYRETGREGLNDAIGRHDSLVCGQILPAGQALIDANLFTSTQLTNLGAVGDSALGGACGDTLPADAEGLDWLKTFDLKAAFPIKLGEKFTIEPSVGIYNLFNFGNYDTAPTTRLTGVLNGTAGIPIGTDLDGHEDSRALQSDGVFNFGAARQLEVGLRITW